jgi:hypothetical protein
MRKIRWRTSFDTLFLPTCFLAREIQAPVHAEASPVPTDHGLGSDNHENLLPSGPEPASQHPEEFVQGAKLGFGMPTLQYRELLSKRQILQKQAST